MVKADIAEDGLHNVGLWRSSLNREMSHVLPPIHSLNLSERTSEGALFWASKRQWYAPFYVYHP
jgi:hypothetical protein